MWKWRASNKRIGFIKKNSTHSKGDINQQMWGILATNRSENSAFWFCDPNEDGWCLAGTVSNKHEDADMSKESGIPQIASSWINMIWLRSSVFGTSYTLQTSNTIPDWICDPAGCEHPPRWSPRTFVWSTSCAKAAFESNKSQVLWFHENWSSPQRCWERMPYPPGFWLMVWLVWLYINQDGFPHVIIASKCTDAHVLST